MRGAIVTRRFIHLGGVVGAGFVAQVAGREEVFRHRALYLCDRSPAPYPAQRWKRQRVKFNVSSVLKPKTVVCITSYMTYGGGPAMMPSLRGMPPLAR